MVSPGISVIICCYNSAKRISETLKHLATQELHPKLPCEVILVDNMCTDETVDVAMATWDSCNSPLSFQVVKEPMPGLAYARRKGVLNAKYTYGIFCDDDNWLDSKYFSRVIECFKQHTDVGAVGGASIPEGESSLPPWFYSNAKSFAVGCQSDVDGDITWRKFVWGAGMGFRIAPLKNLYQAGIKPLVVDREGAHLTSGGDGEICSWLIFSGYRLYYTDRLRFKHYMPMERLTDQYQHRFLQTSHPSAWTAYSDYLTVRYRLGMRQVNIKSKALFLLKYMHALIRLACNLRVVFQVMQIESRIKRVSARHHDRF